MGTVYYGTKDEDVAQICCFIMLLIAAWKYLTSKD